MADSEVLVIGGDIVRVVNAGSVFTGLLGDDWVDVRGTSAGGDFWISVPVRRFVQVERGRLHWELRWWRDHRETLPFGSVRDHACALLHSRIRFAMQLFHGAELLLWACPPYSTMRQLILLDEELADGFLNDLCTLLEGKELPVEGDS